MFKSVQLSQKKKKKGTVLTSKWVTLRSVTATDEAADMYKVELDV